MTAGSVPSFVGHNDLPRNLIILGPKALFLEIYFIVAGLSTDCGWMTGKPKVAVETGDSDGSVGNSSRLPPG
jgi:hypothetical protein